MIRPDFPEFRRLARNHNLVPVYWECLADELTPMALFHSLYKSSTHCFLLESVEGGEHLGRYSFAAFEPDCIFRGGLGAVSLKNGRSVRWWNHPRPLEELRRLLKAFRTAEVKGLPRFFGGAVGYVNYDVVRSFEKLPDLRRAGLAMPEISFFLTRDMFVFDHLSHTVKIVRCARVDQGRNLSETYRRAEGALRRAARNIRLGRFVPRTFPAAEKEPISVNLRERREFVRAVKKAKEYISAGDVIQTVLSRKISLNTRAHPLDVYRALRCINPSPYMYFIRDGENHIIGSSPEMLVRLEGRRAETRPIAGTRPRGAGPPLDERLAQDLLRDEKERAEHLMLVDLGRNDLGRVCRPGSVKVPEFMRVERYSHVMHLVSSVVGELESSRDAFDLFRACFPAGTVTGAPKIRAMEIIEELEKSRRGPYAGAVGYFSYSGNMDMAITIRTIVLNGRTAHIQSGAGIVADSVPGKEFLETQDKAAAMRAAIRLAEAG